MARSLLPLPPLIKTVAELELLISMCSALSLTISEALHPATDATYGSARVDLKVGKVAGTTANQETRCKAMTDAHISALRDSYRVGSTGHTAVTITEIEKTYLEFVL